MKQIVQVREAGVTGPEVIMEEGDPMTKAATAETAVEKAVLGHPTAVAGAVHLLETLSAVGMEVETMVGLIRLSQSSS
jgi:2-keto-4-pentenoate hydratase